MLEHLDGRKAGLFLNEAKRVLKSGGILRIAVPDLRLFVGEYLKTEDADRFVTKLHMNRDIPTSLLGRLKHLVVGDRQHQWNYDALSLCRLLTSFGFEKPTALEAGTTTIRDPGTLDLAERVEESLYVEAEKP
jgi:hypothetical protein